jgi:hypothetical protein
MPTRDEFTDRPELVKKRARALMWQRLGLALIGLFVIATLGGLTINSLFAKQQRDQLADCTTPGGKCYEEGQRQARARTKILIDAGNNRAVYTRAVVKAASKCQNQFTAPVPDSVFESCINEKMKEK